MRVMRIFSRIKTPITHGFFLFSFFYALISICTSDSIVLNLYDNQTIFPTALSEKGRASGGTASFHTTASGYNHCNNTFAQPSSGQLCATTTINNFPVSIGIDIISLFYLIPAIFEFICRAIDITGYYYRQERTRILERELYTIDQDRHAFYAYAGYGFRNQTPHLDDMTYLTTTIYELEIKRAALGQTEQARRDAYAHAIARLRPVLQALETTNRRSQEEVYQSNIKALTATLKTIHATPFISQTDKQRITTEYEQQLAGEKQRYRQYQTQERAAEQRKQDKIEQERADRERTVQQQQNVQIVFTQSLPTLTHTLQEYEQLRPFYVEYLPIVVPHLDKRVELLTEIENGTAYYSRQTYLLSDKSSLLLSDGKHVIDTFTVCYGNQYQQALHQEAIAILYECTLLTASSVLYQHRDLIVTFAEVACEYNHAGECYHATPLIDLCWTMLSYGNAILQGVAEGAINGVIGAVQDIIEHPVQTAISITVGNSVMLTYQLSKVLYTVADLSITLIVDPVAGEEKWATYIKPLETIITAIQNKEIGLKEASKAVTHFGLQWYTSAKLLGGLSKLYSGIKLQALAFAQNYSSLAPPDYVKMPDGLLMHAATTAAQKPVPQGNDLFLQSAINPDGSLYMPQTSLLSDMSVDIAETIRAMVTTTNHILEYGFTGALTLA